MRNPDRIDIITDQINRLWHKHPDQRFGQLMFNIMSRMQEVHKVQKGYATGIDPFHLEDDKLIEYLNALMKEK